MLPRRFSLLPLLLPYWALAASSADTNATASLGLITVEAPAVPFYDFTDAQSRELEMDSALSTATASSANPYAALKLLPSVQTESHDAYGLTADQSTLRVRGQVGDTFSRLSTTVDGVPVGINVGNAGTGYIIDRENLSGMSFSTGILPGNAGNGLGTTAGALDLHLRRPSETTGVRADLATGSDRYDKMFLRFDSGEFAPGAKLFISASTGSNEKWRGEGGISRDNAAAMLDVAVSDALRVELFGAFNRFERDEYRPLDYEQARNLDVYGSYDYTTAISGDAATDASFYGFNRQYFDEYAAYLGLYARFGETTLSVKPYLLSNEGERYLGDPAKRIVKRIEQTQEVYGVTLEAERPLYGGTLYGGLWYQEADSTPPPNLMKMYDINADGTLSYRTIGMLTENGDRRSLAPYIGYKGEFGATSLNFSLRRLSFDFPSVTGYLTAGIGDVDYDTALVLSGGIKPGMQVSEKREKLWLPSLFVEQDLGGGLGVGGGYGRNYANPWQGPLWSVYNSNTAKFSAAGISLQDLWNELRLETSDNFELFARYAEGPAAFKVTLFYGDYRHKQVTVYDPALNLSYYKSNAEATSRGAEAEASWRCNPHLSLFASAYYNRFEFDRNILLATDTYLNTKGKQVPDVAKVGFKAGFSLDYGPWRFAPLLRFVGKRYGDAENSEKIGSHALVDLGAGYEMVPGAVRWELSVQNLFNRRYVGVINNGLDDTRTGATSYYPGAPFSALLSLHVAF